MVFICDWYYPGSGMLDFVYDINDLTEADERTKLLTTLTSSHVFDTLTRKIVKAYQKRETVNEDKGNLIEIDGCNKHEGKKL